MRTPFAIKAHIGTVPHFAVPLFVSVVLISAIVLAKPTVASNPILWGGLEPGPYPVGFTVIQLEDPSRSYGQSLARPIQVSVWYPAARDSVRLAQRMLFSDYIVLYTTPVTSPGQLTGAARAAAIDRYRKEWFPKESESNLARLLGTPTFAVRDGLPAGGRFPLVIYAPGYGGSPLTHTPTAEYLASHGYVVAMSPSQGESAAGMTFDAAGQEQQVRDIEFMAGTLRTRPDVISSKLAFIGFSMGGGSAVIAAMRIPDVDAVVSLDGTVAFDHTVDFLRQATGYDPAAFRSPLLALKAEDDSDEDLSVIRALVLSDREVIRFKGVDHHDFIASPVIASVATGKIAASGRVAYPLVARTVLGFLDEHNRGFNAGLHSHVKETLGSSAQAGDPSSDLLLPRLAAPTPQELISKVLDSGDVNALVDAQHALSKQAPCTPLLNAGALHMLGLRFMDRGQNDKAVQIYELFVELYPQDFFALNLLGDLYRTRNEVAKAERCYQQSLSIRKGNGSATEGLRKLKEMTGGNPVGK